MVDEAKLSDVLSEFARTMITDFPIQRILDRLVDRIVDVMPITAAGVTLITEGSTPHYIAASNDAARRYERLQSEVRQGPCYEAFHTGEPVALPDVANDQRFPEFSPAATKAGLAAVFTFPLRHGNERFGALDLYRDTPGPIGPASMVAAQTLADVAAALLLNARARQEALAASDQFHYNAMHDPLTGLANRVLLQDRMERAALRANRAHTFTAVLFLDLDGFKVVNDTHGHHVGDQLLCSVATRLTTVVREGDTPSRVSGDEFVYLCEELASLHDVTKLVERILGVFDEPFQLDDVVVEMRTSVGVAYVGPGEAMTFDLLRRADLDMYRAKRGSAEGAVAVRASTMPSTDDGPFEQELRLALDNGQLEIAYQPIVRTHDGSVTGVEALLRWTDPDRGEVSPLSMVSVAERSDLICRIGAWVLETACTDSARWRDEHPDVHVDLAVNVSVRQLMAPEFCSMVRDVLERTGMEARSLVLELTESIAMEHSERIRQMLLGLAELGARLALDDFGTGYSSLSYLSRLPIQLVKIDAGLIAALDQPSGRIIVSAVTRMVQELGLEVVAEGVETELQRDETVAVGCDYAQGYFHGRPMTSDAISELLVAAGR